MCIPVLSQYWFSKQMWSRAVLTLDSEIRCWKLVQSNSIWLMSMLNLWSYMNRSHGASEGWCHDLKVILIVGLETRFNYLLPDLEMCKAHEISTNYRHKKWTHRNWLDKNLWWGSEPVQLWTLSWFSSEIYMLGHRVPTKIIFEMWNKSK